MNKDKHMKKGENFLKEGHCYIHVEAENGHLRSACSGDTETIMEAVYSIIERVSKESGAPFDVLITSLETWHKIDTDLRR